jgi:hypothetical protein
MVTPRPRSLAPTISATRAICVLFMAAPPYCSGTTAPKAPSSPNWANTSAGILACSSFLEMWEEMNEKFLQKEDIKFYFSAKIYLKLYTDRGKSRKTRGN